jgi:hypothetical protein
MSGSRIIIPTTAELLTITGVPAAGQVLTATSAQAAHWAPGGGGTGLTAEEVEALIAAVAFTEKRDHTVSTGGTYKPVQPVATIFVTTSSATVELPKASAYKGYTFKVINTAPEAIAVTMTIAAAGGEYYGPLFAKAASIKLSSVEPYSQAEFTSDGSNWNVN